MADTGVATQVAPDFSGRREVAVSRRTRIFGLVILLAVSIASSIFNSTISFFSTESIASNHDLAYLRLLLKEVASLGLLVYILHRNGQTTRDIGFKLSPADLVHAGLLIIGCSFTFRLSRDFATDFYKMALGHAPPVYTSNLVGVGLIIGTVVAFVNPFFEELIVRAFLISEVTLLTGSAALAVVLSVLLQTSYHLYQGVPNAIGHAFEFLILSVYYARKRRAWPIILAHIYADLYAVNYYLRHVG